MSREWFSRRSFSVQAKLFTAFAGVLLLMAALSWLALDRMGYIKESAGQMRELISKFQVSRGN